MVVWYSHLFQNFPQFIVIHTVKGCGIVNKTSTSASLTMPKPLTVHKTNCGKFFKRWEYQTSLPTSEKYAH